MDNRPKWILAAIILVAVILRVAAALYLGNDVADLPGTADQVSYHTLALRLLDGHGFTFGEPWWPATRAGEPTAHWSYLYTGYLVLVYALFGANPLVARLIQVVLVGVLQPVLVYLIGRRLFNNRVALIAAAITSVYAYFVYYAANLMTESFYILSILASLYLAIKMADVKLAGQRELPGKQVSSFKLALALGLVLGSAVLLRQLFLLFIPFLFLWIVWAGGRRLIPPLLLTSLIIAALILPFSVYNYLRFDRVVLLNTNAGFAFFWGNHPIYGTRFEPILPPEMGTYAGLIPEELLHLDEAALDQALLGRAVQFILDDPVRYGLLSLSRIPAYFMFWSSEDSSTLSNIARIASFGLFWPFMLYGLIRSLGYRTEPAVFRPVLLLYLFMLVYTGVHLLTWALIRYRLPVDAVLVLFAGLAVADLVERFPALARQREGGATN